MLKSLLIALLCLTLYDCGKSRPQPQPTPVPTIQPTPEPTSTVQPSPSPTATPTPIPLPCNDGPEITATLTAAIRDGSKVTDSGCIRSEFIVDGSLNLGAGVFQFTQPILVKSGGSINCDNWNSVIIGDNFTVIAAHDSYKDGVWGHSAVDSNITITNCRILDTPREFDSVNQTISLGNCHNCVVEGVWLDNTQTIGIQLGGASLTGQYAKDSKISNCLLTGVASQALAVVNAENVEVSQNIIRSPGQMGGPSHAAIDLEVNSQTDRLINVRVTNNTIQFRGGYNPGNGIIANSGESPNVSGVVIDNNTIDGGREDDHLSNGLMVFGEHMNGTQITRNKVSHSKQTGIWLVGSALLAEGNEFDSVGGGGVEGFRLVASNSRISGNKLQCSSGSPCDSRMVVSGLGNTIDQNIGWDIVQMKRRSRRR